MIGRTSLLMERRGVNGLPDASSYKLVEGTGGADVLSGGGGDDTISGLGGNDSIQGRGGTDWIYGGEGDDSLAGGRGGDNLFADTGDDTMLGGAGDDVLWLNFGDAVVDGGRGTDWLAVSPDVTVTVRIGLGLGYSPQNTELGKLVVDGIENLLGGAGSDALGGDAGRNVLTGQGGIDTIFGEGGNDYLAGNDGGDSMNGGRGDDTLVGGAGEDWLYGKAGADRFVFSNADIAAGRDIIAGALTDEDRIDLSLIDAQPLIDGDQAFILVAGFTGHAGQAVIRYDQPTSSTRVELDLDGGASPDYYVYIHGQDRTDFTNIAW